MSKLIAKYIDDIFVQDSGSGNGATVTFTLSETPHSITNVQVFLNGLKQTLTDDYSVSLAGPSVTFVTAPATGQEININYIKV